MNATRTWPTAVVVSGATGRLLCAMGDLHEFLDWVTGDTLMTHQLPRAFNAAMPVLLAQFPWMATLEFPPDGAHMAKSYWRHFAADLAAEHGESLEVTPLAQWERRNPIGELIDMVGEDRVVSVIVDGAR